MEQDIYYLAAGTGEQRYEWVWLVKDGVPVERSTPCPAVLTCCVNCEKYKHEPLAGIFVNGTSWGNCKGPHAEEWPNRGTPISGGEPIVRETDRCTVFVLRENLWKVAKPKEDGKPFEIEKG